MSPTGRKRALGYVAALKTGSFGTSPGEQPSELVSCIWILQVKESHMPRELIDTGNDKRFVRRDKEGKFKESADVGRSLAADQRQHAKTKVKKGNGDRGDR